MGCSRCFHPQNYSSLGETELKIVAQVMIVILSDVFASVFAFWIKHNETSYSQTQQQLLKTVNMEICLKIEEEEPGGTIFLFYFR